jgi:hypothetical protein
MSSYLMHYGIKGQKWGVRRYQNEDGSLTEEGKRRLGRVLELRDKFNKADEENIAVGQKQRDYLSYKKGYKIKADLVKSGNGRYKIEPKLVDKNGKELPKDTLKKLYKTDKEWKKLADKAEKSYKTAISLAAEFDDEYEKVKNIDLGLLQGTINDHWDSITYNYDKYKKMKVNDI